MTGKLENVAAWRRQAVEGGRWAKWTLERLIARKERKLSNSMAYVSRARPGDVRRWQAMRDEIDGLRAEFERRYGRPPRAGGHDAGT